jgi:hypothetical protein
VSGLSQAVDLKNGQFNRKRNKGILSILFVKKNRATRGGCAARATSTILQSSIIICHSMKFHTTK